MVIVKVTSTKVMCIDNNKFVKWEVFNSIDPTEDAKEYVKKEEDKIEAANSKCISLVHHRKGTSQLYTPAQFDKLKLHEIADMEVGMLFSIKMICIG